MLYAIISEDVEDSLTKRMAVRPEHLARLQVLKDQGRLVIAGPHPKIDSNDPGPSGYTGSLIIAEFASLDEAQEWASQDPYIDAKIYRKVTVKPFKKTMP